MRRSPVPIACAVRRSGFAHFRHSLKTRHFSRWRVFVFARTYLLPACCHRPAQFWRILAVFWRMPSKRIKTPAIAFCPFARTSTYPARRSCHDGHSGASCLCPFAPFYQAIFARIFMRIRAHAGKFERRKTPDANRQILRDGKRQMKDGKSQILKKIFQKFLTTKRGEKFSLKPRGQVL